MPRTTARLALAPVIVAALALAGCASSPGTGAEPSTVPDGSETATPSPSSTQEPTESAEPDWQMITTPDGATFEIPADWSTSDETITNDVGSVTQIDVHDADGSLVLSYMHDEGGAGGLGGACDSHPASEVFVSEGTTVELGSMATAGETVIAAYAIEQQQGVELTMGYTDASAFEHDMCLTYNTYIAPDGMLGSFASSLSGGSDLDLDAGPTGGDPMWRFDSFDEARAFVDSDDGQTIMQVLESLRFPA